MTTVRHWKRASQPAAVMCFTWRRLRLRVRVGARVRARARVRVN